MFKKIDNFDKIVKKELFCKVKKIQKSSEEYIEEILKNIPEDLEFKIRMKIFHYDMVTYLDEINSSSLLEKVKIFYTNRNKLADSLVKNIE